MDEVVVGAAVADETVVADVEDGGAPGLGEVEVAVRVADDLRRPGREVLQRGQREGGAHVFPQEQVVLVERPAGRRHLEGRPSHEVRPEGRVSVVEIGPRVVLRVPEPHKSVADVVERVAVGADEEADAAVGSPDALREGDAADGRAVRGHRGRLAHVFPGVDVLASVRPAPGHVQRARLGPRAEGEVHNGRAVGVERVEERFDHAEGQGR